MKLVKTCVVLFLAVTLSVTAYAQKNYLKEADVAFHNLQYFSAIELYKKAYAKEKDKATKSEIVFKIAESFRNLNDLKQAETWYGKAIKAKYQDPIAIYWMAEMMKENEKYAEAQAKFNEYKAARPEDKRGEDGAKSCELAQKWKDNPTRYIVSNEAQLNSSSSDYSPMYVDKKFSDLYFTSTRPGANGSDIDDGTGESFSDIYETKRDKKGKWSTPVAISKVINSEANESSVSINHKYNTMFFTRCPNEKKKNLGCELFFTEKKGNDWDAVTMIKVTSDSFSVGQPCINEDDTRLYFSSDMPGGLGGHDIWYIEYDKKEKKWSETPVNLGAPINTAYEEYFPYVHPDGSLYFSSNGHLGMGGLDLFRAEKSGGNFTNVTNLKFPMNSSADDFGIMFEGDKERGFFCSNRKDGKGLDDIYSFVLPPLVFEIQGVVKNTNTKLPIAGATIKMVGSDGSSVETTTDKSGFFKFAENGPDRYVKANVTYTLVASAVKFLNSEKGKVSTVGEDKNKTFQQDFELQPIDVPIELPNIFYDLGKWELRPESMVSLDKLVQTLNDNPNIVIKLGSHTDCRGDEKSNQVLSENRAKSVVEYLITKGIESERLEYVGYGESRPKKGCTEAEINKLKTKEEQEAAHQQNRRTDFEVLRTNYVPKTKTEGSAPVQGGK